MTAQQAQIALVVAKAAWASMPAAVKAKIKDFVLAEIKDLTREEIHEFFASLPPADPLHPEREPETGALDGSPHAG